MARSKSIIVRGEQILVQEDQILKFQEEIENLVENGGLNYIEAICHYCDMCDVDVESVKNLISVSLMSKIHEEASNLNLLKVKPSNTLPLDD